MWLWLIAGYFFCSGMFYLGICESVLTDLPVLVDFTVSMIHLYLSLLFISLFLPKCKTLIFDSLQLWLRLKSTSKIVSVCASTVGNVPFIM